MAPLSIKNIVAIVLEYHKPALTLSCIQSLKNAGVTQILIWDNSTDSGESRAEIVKNLTGNKDLAQRVRLFGNNTNLGFSSGINAAISHISDKDDLPYVLLMNNDANINEEGVNALFEALMSDPKNALAAPQFIYAHEKMPAMKYYNKYFSSMTKKKHIGSFAFLSGCCLLLDLRKADIIPLDPDFFMYGEDVALSYSLQKKGYLLAIAESAKVDHIGAASSVTGSPFYEYHVIRGHILLTSRIATSSLHAALLWPTRLISLSARSILRALRAKSWVPISALWRAFFALGPA